MLHIMASLDFYIRMYGRREGRKRYNDYHRAYRKTHRTKLRKYWRDRKKAQKPALTMA